MQRPTQHAAIIALIALISTLALSCAQEPASKLGLTLAPGISEGEEKTGTVTLSRVAETIVAVSISNSQSGLSTFPAAVVVPAGAASAAFEYSMGQNNYLDGTVEATITATAQGWEPFSTKIGLGDDEPRVLQLDLPDSIGPGATATATLFLSAGTRTRTALEVSVSSLDPARLSIESSTVEIPAGANSVEFPVHGLADGDSDSNVAWVEAELEGFTTAQESVNVTE